MSGWVPKYLSVLGGYFPLFGSHHPPKVARATATKTFVAGVLPLRLWCWQSFSPWPDPNSGSPKISSSASTLGLCLSLHCPILARKLFSRFGQNLPSFIRFLILCSLPGGVWSPGLASASILLGHFSQNPLSPLMFLLSNIPPTDPFCSLAINSHLRVLCPELSPISLLHCETPLPWSLHPSRWAPGIKSPLASLTNVTESLFL